MFFPKRLRLVFTGCMLLGMSFGGVACAGNNVEPLSPDFGNATRQNMAKQIVNPQPMTPTREEAAADGERAFRNVEAYKKGKVEQPRAISTERGGGSSSGTSSSVR